MATIGAYMAGGSKESIEQDIGRRLAIMDSVTPPSDIADAWTAWSDPYRALVAVAAEAEPGSAVFDAELNSQMLELSDDSTEIREFLDRHCF